MSNGVIPTVVAKWQFERRTTKGGRHQLMTQAYAEHRNLAEKLFDLSGRVAIHIGVTGPVRQEHAVGVIRAHIIRACGTEILPLNQINC